MHNILTKVKSAVILTLAFGPVSVLAQGSNVPGVPPENIKTFGGLIGIVNKLLGWFFTALIALAAIFIIFAGFTYLTAGGDEEKVKKAKDRLIYAVVAIAIGLLSTGVKFIVASLVGTNEGAVNVNTGSVPF